MVARLRREHNELAWHAHTVAAIGRAKKVPTLASIQNAGAGKEVRRQSWEEQAALLAEW